MIRFIDLQIKNRANPTASHYFKKHLLVHLLVFFLPCHVTYAALQGSLEGVNCDYISGWAWDDANPDSRVKLNVYDITANESILLTTLTAQTLRTDLLLQGKGDGKYGFSFALPAGIRNGVTHKFSVQFDGTTTNLANSPQTTSVKCYDRLNDTGWKKCADGASNDLNCPVTGYSGQDGNYGRDALARSGHLTKSGKGSAGFDFTKIANDGSKLPATVAIGSGQLAKGWTCTLDNVTGLLWEIKAFETSNLRFHQNTYSWYNTDSASNGGSEGVQYEGACGAYLSCGSQTYVQAVNAIALCGKTDWRLPKVSELLSIVDYSRKSPAINTDFFPSTGSYEYWSSSSDALDGNFAWQVSFDDGSSVRNRKIFGASIQLVSGGQ